MISFRTPRAEEHNLDKENTVNEDILNSLRLSLFRYKKTEIYRSIIRDH